MTEQKSGRWARATSELADLPSGKLDFLLPMVTLRCLSTEPALRVVNEFPNRDRGGRKNIMKADGDSVVITYADKMWPYDIADWASDMGLASDHDSAKVFECL